MKDEESPYQKIGHGVYQKVDCANSKMLEFSWDDVEELLDESCNFLEANIESGFLRQFKYADSNEDKEELQNMIIDIKQAFDKIAELTSYLMALIEDYSYFREMEQEQEEQGMIMGDM